MKNWIEDALRNFEVHPSDSKKQKQPDSEEKLDKITQSVVDLVRPSIFPLNLKAKKRLRGRSFL